MYKSILDSRKDKGNHCTMWMGRMREACVARLLEAHGCRVKCMGKELLLDLLSDTNISLNI